MTDHPAAVKLLIPIQTHGKIDPFNVGGFVLQTFLISFRQDKKAQTFNAIFTAVVGLTVLLTDWESSNAKVSGRA